MSRRISYINHHSFRGGFQRDIEYLNNKRLRRADNMLSALPSVIRRGVDGRYYKYHWNERTSLKKQKRVIRQSFELKVFIPVERMFMSVKIGGFFDREVFQHVYE